MTRVHLLRLLGGAASGVLIASATVRAQQPAPPPPPTEVVIPLLPLSGSTSAPARIAPRQTSVLASPAATAPVVLPMQRPSAPPESLHVTSMFTPTTPAQTPPPLPIPAPPAPSATPVAAASATPARALSAPPQGATMLCKDGSYLNGAPVESRCADRGGLASMFPQPLAAPRAPVRQ